MTKLLERFIIRLFVAVTIATLATYINMHSLRANQSRKIKHYRTK